MCSRTQRMETMCKNLSPSFLGLFLLYLVWTKLIESLAACGSRGVEEGLFCQRGDSSPVSWLGALIVPACIVDGDAVMS